ncbi:MAG: hypothetical protein DMD82_14210 [Candidatus Rokuibacteriota bacterium]|nr:MAG: hypothetical protein DMD82_14210 [Candidatus Rokubacteria bacterium]
MSPIIRRPHGFTARSTGAAALVCVLVGIAGSARDALAGRHTHPAARTSIELKGLDPDDQALWQRLCFRVQDAFDSTYGGFVTRQGVVSESAIDLAFLLGRREGQQRWRGCGVYTVQWMLGLEDSVGGGFYRRREVVAGQGQFDRPTVTNARRLENLIDAWEATNDSRYWVSAVRLLEFAERNVVDGRGGFTSNPVGDQDLVPEANGVAIHAWLRWWAAGRDPRRRDFAFRSIDRVWETAWRESVGFVRTDAFGELLSSPKLADQTEMGRALVLSAQLGGRPQDLDRARRVADCMLSRFLDERGAFRTETPLHSSRFRRPGHDARENARAALFLSELGHVAHEPRYIEAARRTWHAFAKSLEKSKVDNADWALAMDAAIAPVFPKRPPEGARPVDHSRSPRSTGKSRLPAPETKIGAETNR